MKTCSQDEVASSPRIMEWVPAPDVIALEAQYCAKITKLKAQTIKLEASLEYAVNGVHTEQSRREAAEAKVAELEAEQRAMSSSLQAVCLCSPDNDVHPVDVSNSVVIDQMRNSMVKIYDVLAAQFGDDAEHLGQPYGDGFDAILCGLNSLCAHVAELEAELAAGPLPWCHECMSEVAIIDEDGCCMACGADAVVPTTEHVARVAELEDWKETAITNSDCPDDHDPIDYFSWLSARVAELERERDDARARETELESMLGRWQDESGLEGAPAGDPGDVTPEAAGRYWMGVEKERDDLRARVAELEARQLPKGCTFIAEDGDGEEESFDTLEEARNCANEWIKELRKEANRDGEWPDFVEFIRICAVVEKSFEVKSEYGSEFEMRPADWMSDDD